jgi:hypothetical protein
LTLIAQGYETSTYGAGVSVTWSAINQWVSIQYTYGVYTNWTSMGITGFRAWTYSNPLASNAAGVQLYCQSGVTDVWENSSWVNASTSWQQVNWTPPFSASGSSPASVDQFGVQFATGGTSTSWNTDLVEISNVELY